MEGFGDVRGNSVNGVALRESIRSTKKSKNKVAMSLINTRSIRYNPTGPGDYNLPSLFGEP